MQLKEEAPHFKQSFFGSARVRQTNQTALVTLDSTGDKEWIVKSITEKSLGPLETLSQEFFRLLIPHQPETRLIAKHEPVEPQRDNSQYIGNEELYLRDKEQYDKAKEYYERCPDDSSFFILTERVLGYES